MEVLTVATVKRRRIEICTGTSQAHIQYTWYKHKPKHKPKSIYIIHGTSTRTIITTNLSRNTSTNKSKSTGTRDKYK